MNNLDYARYALGVCAAAMLADCGGGSGTHLSVYPAGVMAERTHVLPAYRVSYSFKGGSGDGANPDAGLFDVKGTLYGTTYEGGANGDGTVFSITPSGAENVLYSLKGGPGDGANPGASLVNVNGTLYGTTDKGGANGDGTVFSITPSGAENVLYSFKGGLRDGANPYAGLVNVKGTLYGTTSDGGANGDGTVFKITTSGAETVLHNFAGGKRDGKYPYAGLIDVKGTLYGTTSEGGAYGYYGTVFSVTTVGTEKVLHSFGGSGDGDEPFAGLLNVNGALYGTTLSGGAYSGGTVFSITPSGAESVIYSFKGDSDGAGLYAGLIDFKGTLYGTTAIGGGVGCKIRGGCGTVFSVTTSGLETVLHRFAGGKRDGRFPSAGLINVKGTLYGTTTYSGAYGNGTVFSLAP